MSRLHALAIVTLFWAAIFLPALGSVELKGEEGRRIMPAATMIERAGSVVSDPSMVLTLRPMAAPRYQESGG